MRPAEILEQRLTIACIRNSFQVSGKRHLLLTGSPGSGITTLLARLADPLELRDVDTQADLRALEGLL